MPWNTTPVYPGVTLDLGDTSYTPGTKEKQLYTSSNLFTREDVDRITEQTLGNWGYILRPYSQSSWKPKVDSNLKKSSTSTGKPRTSTPSATGKPRTSTPSATGKPRTAPKAPTSNSWINKGRGIWNYNGVSQADVANAYKTGDFSKVGSYLSQHKDLASYLNNIYSKRGGNLFNLSIPTQLAAPIQETPGYGIHVGNNGVTLTTPNGLTTDVTNSHNLRETIWGSTPNPTSEPTSEPTVNTLFLEQTASNLVSPNLLHFGRRETRDFMRLQGLVNPYDYSASERRAFRHSINNDTGDWSDANRIISDIRKTNALAQAAGLSKYLIKKPQIIMPYLLDNKLGQDVGLSNYLLETPQINMPNLLNNNLVNLKFKQGGQMYKLQQGDQALQAIALVQAAMQGDLLANLTIQLIMLAAKLGDLQAAQVVLLLQAVMLQMKGSRKARLGAKLNYIKLSIGECPEGLEVVYFKKGGELCKACQRKKPEKGNAIELFKKKRMKR